MAERCYFKASSDPGTGYFLEELAAFTFNNGMAPVQKVRNIRAMHESILGMHSDARILEISTKSGNQLGASLSAFNLKLEYFEAPSAVESAFQGSKVFEMGGPFRDLVSALPWEAKKDERLRTSGPLIAFELDDGERFAPDGSSDFYDVIYLRALLSNPDQLEELSAFDTFTDIEFNKTKLGFQPKKSFNTQARSCAIAVSLYLTGGSSALEEHIETLMHKTRTRNSGEKSTDPGEPLPTLF